jgi:glycosyltransferase involved in cell wall biosynthesis
LALLAHGVPTVALRTPYDDAVFDGAVAVAADESQLAVRLQSLLGDLAARRTLGAAAAACYAENFSWTTVAGRLRRSLDVADHDRRRAGERRA